MNILTVVLIAVGLGGTAISIIYNFVKKKLLACNRDSLGNELVRTGNSPFGANNPENDYIRTEENQIKKDLEGLEDLKYLFGNEKISDLKGATTEEAQPLELSTKGKNYVTERLGLNSHNFLEMESHETEKNSNKVIDLLGLIANDPQFFEKNSAEKILNALSAFLATIRITENLMEVKPRLAIRNMVHNLETDFRGNRDRVAEFIKNFGFSAEDTRLFIEALTEEPKDPNTVKMLFSLIAQNFNIEKTIF